ncbi:hypothetical protein HOY80DRAFT_1000944 [Tuber brumale]|nr:hypothetical protein HOY80DRAFT_1000944 [Tuber brumale]
MSIDIDYLIGVPNLDDTFDRYSSDRTRPFMSRRSPHGDTTPNRVKQRQPNHGPGTYEEPSRLAKTFRPMPPHELLENLVILNQRITIDITVTSLMYVGGAGIDGRLSIHMHGTRPVDIRMGRVAIDIVGLEASALAPPIRGIRVISALGLEKALLPLEVPLLTTEERVLRLGGHDTLKITDGYSGLYCFLGLPPMWKLASPIIRDGSYDMVEAGETYKRLVPASVGAVLFIDLGTDWVRHRAWPWMRVIPQGISECRFGLKKSP